MRAIKLGLRVVVFAVLILAAIELSAWIKDHLDFTIMPHTETIVYRTVLLAVGVYILLMATPFLPGAEIGLVLLTGLGASVAPLVYAATLLALSFTFALGRMVKPETTARMMDRIGLHRAADLLRRVGQTPPDARFDLLLNDLDTPWLRHCTRFRYVALALLLNLPGNVVIGGGGGLALVAGLSQVFHPLAFVATVAIAVLPVPLFVFVMS